MLRVMPDSVELSQVFAANARKLRGSAMLDDVAKAARRHGANWTPSKVSDLEHGRVAPTLANLVIAAFALTDVRGETVFVTDLVESDQTIVLAKGFDVTSDELKVILTGDEKAYSRVLDQTIDRTARSASTLGNKIRGTWPPRLRKVSVGDMRRVSADCGEPEMLLARDLGIKDQDRLVAEMAALWGQSFRAERDKRAGSGANAQKRGRVSRALKAELKAVLDGDD